MSSGAATSAETGAATTASVASGAATSAETGAEATASVSSGAATSAETGAEATASVASGAATSAETGAATTDVVTPRPRERAKYGRSHEQRMTRKKRKQADRDLLMREKCLPKGKKAKHMRIHPKRQLPDTVETPASKRQRCMTGTQVSDAITTHAKALYTLSTRGSRRDDRQYEREDYNLLVFSQSEMLRWDKNAHVWNPNPQDSDMSKLPTNISIFYDTTGWKCINTLADGDGVVFLRPTPHVPRRGCGALRRRKNFKWTAAMSVWLQKHTSHLTFKSVPFAGLEKQAEQIWGYNAPKQEHLENKIRGRDKAKKEGRPPPRWVNDTL